MKALCVIYSAVCLYLSHGVQSPSTCIECSDVKRQLERIEQKGFYHLKSMPAYHGHRKYNAIDEITDCSDTDLSDIPSDTYSPRTYKASVH